MVPTYVGNTMNIKKKQQNLNYKRLHYLSRYPGLNIVALGVADLGVEVEHGAHFDRLTEPDVVHVHAVGAATSEHVGIGPGQLKGLPHDEAAKDLVEPVPVLRLADDEVLELGVLHPHGVDRFHAGLEGHGLQK